MIDWQSYLITLIVEYFNFSFGKEESFTGTFVIWVGNSNPQYQSLVHEQNFEKNLRNELENRQLFAASNAKIDFKTENPPQDAGYLELKNDKISDIYIQRIEKEVEPEETNTITKARISILNNRGSLMQEEYILDATKQTEYNIGRGEGNYNNIIIRENDSEHTENGYVSSRHAKIIFIERQGFCLQSRNDNNRTIINRNNQRFAKITKTESKTPLKNNDEIELGYPEKKVCLLFEIIE